MSHAGLLFQIVPEVQNFSVTKQVMVPEVCNFFTPIALLRILCFSLDGYFFFRIYGKNFTRKEVSSKTLTERVNVADTRDSGSRPAHGA